MAKETEAPAEPEEKVPETKEETPPKKEAKSEEEGTRYDGGAIPKS